MKKKLLISTFIILAPIISVSQTYSTFYGNYKVNQNVNVNQDVNVKQEFKVNKTVKTIDYGALANANAQRERNRIESLKLKNSRDYDAMIAIASDPSKAYDYGTDVNFGHQPGKWLVQNVGSGANRFASFFRDRGFRKGFFMFKQLHESLFQMSNGVMRNISDNGITTEFMILGGVNLDAISDENQFPVERDVKKLGAEEWAKGKDYTVGEINENFGGNFIHNIDVNKAIVYGINGFVQTIAYEDDYDYIIKDNYVSVSADGIVYFTGVRFSGDKDEVSFEDLEGRRYYFRKLMKQTIGSAKLYNYKKRF